MNDTAPAEPLPRDVAATLESFRRTITEKAEREKARAPEPKPPTKVVQLPMWPEKTRGTPNTFLRGALFSAIQGKERRALKGELLACQKGQCIRFTGWQLDQSDLDVWEQAAELARTHPLGNVCHFSINGFLRALDRPTGKAQHEWLKSSFRRLMAAGVEITEGRHTYGGSLLEFARDEIDEVYIVRLNPTILNLYRAGWTAVDWDIRRRLRRKPLALWLHGWLSSNVENYSVKLETIRQLSGSRNPHMGSFKRQVQAALADLQAEGVLRGHSIEDGLVAFDRTPAPTQIRHLARKGKPRRKP